MEKTSNEKEKPVVDIKQRLMRDLEKLDQQIKKNRFELASLQARTEQLVGMAAYVKAMLTDMGQNDVATPKPDAS